MIFSFSSANGSSSSPVIFPNTPRSWLISVGLRLSCKVVKG